jgi:hypothetical protein
MKTYPSRRAFLADVSRGMIVATVGTSLASELGLGIAHAGDGPGRLEFGPIEPLVGLMQDTPADQLLPKLRDLLRDGQSLRRLVAAGALANARTFGGEDYVGYHTLMALGPALEMSRELPQREQALPVFKVLYRNTQRLQERDGSRRETLHAVAADGDGQSVPQPHQLRRAIQSRDMAASEKTLAMLAKHSPELAFNELLYSVQDFAEVHRVVLPYRAWELLDVTGPEHAQTLLRQSLHYCVQAEAGRNDRWNQPRDVLARAMDEHGLMDATPGNSPADDGRVEEMSRSIFGATPSEAASIAASALAEGLAPGVVGEAVALAANQLVLRDRGRTPREEQLGKPVGSVHGDSIGVHACDSANAWCNMARVTNARNTFACLILGAYQVAYDRVNRGGDFLNWDPVPVPFHVERIASTEAADLLRELDESIRNNLQAQAAARVHRYCALGHDPRKALDLMLRYSVSEDGSLHAEKYYRTATQEYGRIRTAFRDRQLLALARVTASEYGRPAPGMAEARELLGV